MAMKKNYFFTTKTMLFAMLIVMTFTFAACSQDQDIFDIEHIEPPIPGGETGYDLDNEGTLTHNPQTVVEENHGSLVDTMTSKISGRLDGEYFLYQQNPIAKVEAFAEDSDLGVKEDYVLNITGLTFSAEKPTVDNIDGYYHSMIDYNGELKVDGQNVTLKANTLNFAKYYSPNENVFYLKGTDIDSVKTAGYTIVSQGEEYTEGELKVKDVVFRVNLKVYRSEFGVGEMKPSDVNDGNRPYAQTKATNKSSDIVEELAFLVTRTVKAGVVPEDTYSHYDNVRQTVVVNWNKMVTEYKIVADEHYTVSGIRPNVLVAEGELPFGYNVPALHTFVSKAKDISLGSSSNDINSDSEANFMQKHTLVSTYTVNLVDASCDKPFTFWWNTGWVEFHGDRIDINVPAPTQVCGGFQQKSETSDDTYKTITTYDVKNNISFGGNKTVTSPIVVKVEKDEEVPVTIKDVKISQKRVEEETRTAITVTADITYSDNTTAKKDTVVYRAHGASNASPINVTKDNKNVAFVNNNVTSQQSGNRINYTNAVTVKYSNNSTDVMSFTSWQEEGGSIVFMDQTVQIEVATMIPSYVSLVEGSTTVNGNVDVTVWTVNAKSVIGSKTLNQKGNINVSVESYVHPELGRLIGVEASYTLCNYRPNYFWDIFVLKYEKGFRVEADNVMQSEIWKNEDFHSSILGKINSATSLGPNKSFMPAEHKVYQGGDGYWEWWSKDASGKEYRTSFPYKFDNRFKDKPNYCKRTVTFEFVGDQMIVKENGQQVRSFSRR